MFLLQWISLRQIFRRFLNVFLGVERLESDWYITTENTNFVLTPEPRGFAPNAFGANYGNAGVEAA